MQYLVEQAAAREPLLSYAIFFVTGRWTAFLKLLLSIFTKRNETKQIFLFLKSSSGLHFDSGIFVWLNDSEKSASKILFACQFN